MIIQIVSKTHIWSFFNIIICYLFLSYKILCWYF